MNRSPRTILFAAVAGATVVLAAACAGGDDDGPTTRVFDAPPWSGEEAYSYQLSMRGEDDAGTCDMKTEPEFEAGKTRLSLLCHKDPFRDERVSVVESATLRPITSERLVEPKAGEVTRSVTTYRDTDVLFEVSDDDGEHDTTRDLPKATEDNPDPGWYDDDTLMWLVRGIPLRNGFEGTYAHVINAGQPRVLRVQVEVEGTESITIGGRDVETWKVRVHKDNTNYRFWIEMDGSHRVLQARIEDTTFEMIDPFAGQ